VGEREQRRFEEEAEILAHLNHPGIARLFEGGFYDGPLGPQPFFAMELVEGKPLTLFAEHRALGASERVRLLSEVRDAVQHAHQKGIIHCDLKPANILVEVSGRAKVVDFGIAQWLEPRGSTLTDVAGVEGTPEYMCPENGPASNPTSAGTSSPLARSAAGWSGSIQVENSVSRGTRGHGARASQLSAGARLGSSEPSAKAKDRELRYESVSALGADLQRWFAFEPTQAFAGGRVHRLALFARRNPLLLSSFVVIQALLLGGVSGIARQWKRAVHAAAEAREAARKQQASVEFLEGIFPLAHPEGARGQEITMRAVLELEGADDGERVRVLITTLERTERVDGVRTRVVAERAWVDGELVEVSRNFWRFRLSCG